MSLTQRAHTLGSQPVIFAGRTPFALHLMSPTHPPEQVDAMFQRLRFAGLDNVLVLQRRAA